MVVCLTIHLHPEWQINEKCCSKRYAPFGLIGEFFIQYKHFFYIFKVDYKAQLLPRSPLLGYQVSTCRLSLSHHFYNGFFLPASPHLLYLFTPFRFSCFSIWPNFKVYHFENYSVTLKYENTTQNQDQIVDIYVN